MPDKTIMRNLYKLTVIATFIFSIAALISCGGGGGSSSYIPVPSENGAYITFEGALPESASGSSFSNPLEKDPIFQSSEYVNGKYSIIASDVFLNAEYIRASVENGRFKIRIELSDNAAELALVIKDNSAGRLLFRNAIGKLPRKSELPPGVTSIVINNVEINDFSTSLTLFAAEKKITLPRFMDFDINASSTEITKNYQDIKAKVQNILLNNSGGISNALELAKAVKTSVTVLVSDNLTETSKNAILPTQRNFIDATAALSLFIDALNSPEAAAEINRKNLDSSAVINKSTINSATDKFSIKSLIASINPLEKNAAPIFSPSPAKYTSTVEVSITTLTSGASIYFTLDGKTPGISSRKYISPITISSTTLIKAIAIKSDSIDSDISSATFEISLPAAKTAKPVFFPAEDTFNETTEIKILCATEGAAIYYTQNGELPSISSQKYEKPLLISSSVTIKAIAVKESMRDSDIASASYTINISGPQVRVSKPSFSPGPNTFISTCEVKIRCITEGAEIYYTLDSSAPSKENGIKYEDGGIIKISSTTLLKAIATRSGLLNSLITEGTYEIIIPVQIAEPTFKPAAGTYNSTREISITCSTEGADIYYTTDGTNPTPYSLKYAGPIVVDKNMTIKAFAIKNGMLSSRAASSDYIINFDMARTAAPQFNYPSGTYEKTLEVALSTGTPGAVIYYTLDYSEPNIASTRYEKTLEIYLTSIIKAVAVKAGMSNSEITSADYTMKIPGNINIPKVTGLFYYSADKILKWNEVKLETNEVEYAVTIDGQLIPQYVTKPEFSLAAFLAGTRYAQVQAKLAGSSHALDFGPQSNSYKFTIKSVSNIPTVNNITTQSGYLLWDPLCDSETVYGYRIMFDDELENLFITKAACYAIPQSLARGKHKARIQTVQIDDSGLEIIVLDEGNWSDAYSLNVENTSRPFLSIPTPENLSYEPISDSIIWNIDRPNVNYAFAMFASYNQGLIRKSERIKLDLAETTSVSLELIKSSVPLDSYNCLLEVITFDGFNYSLKSQPVRMPNSDIPKIPKVTGLTYDPNAKYVNWNAITVGETACTYNIKIDTSLMSMSGIPRASISYLRSGSHEIQVQAIMQNYNPAVTGPFSDSFFFYLDSHIPMVDGLNYSEANKSIRWGPMLINDQACYYRVKIDGIAMNDLVLRAEYPIGNLSKDTHEVCVQAVIPNSTPEQNGPYSVPFIFCTKSVASSNELEKIARLDFDAYNNVVRWQPTLVEKLPIASYIVELDGAVITHPDGNTYITSANWGVSENVTRGQHSLRVKPFILNTNPQIEGSYSEPFSFLVQRPDTLYANLPQIKNLIFQENIQSIVWDEVTLAGGDMPTYNVIAYFNTGTSIAEQSFPIQEPRLNIGVLRFDPRFLSMPSGKYSIEVQTSNASNKNNKALKSVALILELTDDRSWKNIK